MVMMKLGLGMLSQCSHRVYGPLCSEAAKRAATHLEAWFEIHTLDDTVVRFRKLVSLYREDTWLKPSGVDRPRDGEPGHIIQVFIDKAASSERLTQLICAVVVDSMSEIGQGAVAINRECHGMDGALPKAVHPLLRSLRAFEFVEDIASKVQTGKGGDVTIAELNEGLAELSFANETVPSAAAKRPCWAATAERVQAEFDIAFDSLTKKMARVRASCIKLKEKCGGVLEACDAWDFSQQPWAFQTRQNPDKELADVAKNIEHCNSQIDSIKSQVARLAARTNHMAADVQKQVTDLHQSFTEGTLVNEFSGAVETLAHVYIVNSLFQGLQGQEQEDKAKHPKAAAKWLDHAQRTLKFHPSKLNENLNKTCDRCWCCSCCSCSW